MKIAKIKKIKPEKSHCISVGNSNKLFVVGPKNDLLTHNSVAQQNIIFSCLLRPEHWVMLGIDLKRVELTRFKEYGLKTAVDIKSAVDFLRFAQAVMMKRYARMEDAGVNDFKDLPVPGQALMVMIDEAGELLSPSGSKALSENTIIPTPVGNKLLSDIEPNDIILDNKNLPTKVLKKYEPHAQKHFEVKVSSDKTHQSEKFISGEEHLWTVRLSHPDGTIDKQRIMSTKELNDLIKYEHKLPKYEQLIIKIKKG